MEGQVHAASAVPRVGERTRDAKRGSGAPVLEPKRHGAAARFVELIGVPHPILAFLCAVVLGYVVLAGLSIASGFLVTDVLVDIHGIQTIDERFPRWLAGERTDTLTDLSWVGSELAGGYAIPAILGLVALVMAILRRWTIAAFVLFSVAVESGTYRATTLFVERQRPDVERLESLPVDASYPSGHTAASIALYSGLALLVTSRMRHGGARIAIWIVVLAIPPFVALARIYRGMHHPTDALAGVPIGIAAILVVLFACRVARAAVERRAAGESA